MVVIEALRSRLRLQALWPEEWTVVLMQSLCVISCTILWTAGAVLLALGPILVPLMLALQRLMTGGPRVR